MTNVTPYFRSPFTDVTGAVVSHQYFGRCRDFELRMMDCMEAYGHERGLKKCADLIEDYNECHTMNKQLKRFTAMRIERERQYLAGERKAEDHYAEPPKPHGY